MEVKPNSACNTNDTKYITVGEFIDEFRQAIGDTSEAISSSSIMSYLRRALSYVAREKGLHKLFEYEDTFELSSMRKDGRKASQWTLGGGRLDNIDYITNIEHLVIWDTSGKPINTNLRFVPYYWFIKEFPDYKEIQNTSPRYFTITNIQGKTRLLFDAPISSPHVVEMRYSASHPRITKETDLLRIPYMFVDLFIELSSLFYYKEASDFAFARSQWEDVDYYVAQIREMLYRNHDGAEIRRVKRSF